MRFTERIAQLVEEHPDTRAIEHNRSWTTWGELGAIAEMVTNALEATPETGQPVALLLRERPASVGAFLGCLMAGRRTALVSPLCGEVELAGALDQVGAGILIATDDDWDREALQGVVDRRGVAGIAVGPGTATVRSRPEGAGTADTGSDDEIAFTVMTSGTTGVPKPVAISFLLLDAMAADAEGSDPREAKGATINTLPLVSIGGALGLVRAIVRGRPIALMDRFTVAEWVELVHEHRPRRLGGPPPVLRMILDAKVPLDTFKDVESFETGSARVDPELAIEFESTYGVPVLESYGATEFLAAVAQWTLPDWQLWHDQKRGSVGRAAPGFSLRVTNDGVEVGSDVSGIVEVLAPKSQTWIPTTDVGRIDADGFLWVEGRSDDVIIRGGFKVPLNDVCAVLRTHPMVKDVAVVGLPDLRVGQVPAAAVVLTSDGAATASELLEWAKRKMAPYKVPSRMVLVESLPMNAMMKVQRSAVAALFVDQTS